MPPFDRPQFDQLAQTHEYSPPLAPNSSSLRDRVALIEADEDERTDESLAAWAQRLQIVCAILWAGFLTFFVRNLLAEPIIGPMALALGVRVYGAGPVVSTFGVLEMGTEPRSLRREAGTEIDLPAAAARRIAALRGDRPVLCRVHPCGGCRKNRSELGRV